MRQRPPVRQASRDFGFSLVEMIISMGILSLIALAVSQFGANAFQYIGKTNNYLQALPDLIIGIEKLRSDAKLATSITSIIPPALPPPDPTKKSASILLTAWRLDTTAALGISQVNIQYDMVWESCPFMGFSGQDCLLLQRTFNPPGVASKFHTFDFTWCLDTSSDLLSGPSHPPGFPNCPLTNFFNPAFPNKELFPMTTPFSDYTSSTTPISKRFLIEMKLPLVSGQNRTVDFVTDMENVNPTDPGVPKGIRRLVNQ